MSEHAIQNEIRNALAGKCLAYRANVGRAWTGSKIEKLPDGSILIRDPRPFSTGLPPGFSDLFGLVPSLIKPEHVGQRWGRFFALEVKAPGKNPQPLQRAFLAGVAAQGGVSGVARSAEDALGVIQR